MTPSGTTATWVDVFRPIAAATLRSVVLIGVAALLIFVLLPAALGAVGHRVPIAG